MEIGGRGAQRPSLGRGDVRRGPLMYEVVHLMQQAWPVAADGLVQELTRLQEMHDSCDRASHRSENLSVCVVFMSVRSFGVL